SEQQLLDGRGSSSIPTLSSLASLSGTAIRSRCPHSRRCSPTAGGGTAQSPGWRPRDSQ
ncbi:hypothetical protein NDU88_006054, partial [Pleurodeles waltl]